MTDEWPFGFGYCCCGCGQKTEIATVTRTRGNHKEGRPLWFRPGHHTTHKIPPADRFWAKVDKSAGPDACWPWTAGTMVDGYGVFYRAKGRPVGAHRFAWELEHGPIPEGMWVLHHCDNPACCNPAHLFLGTAADNNRDMVDKGRIMHGETHYASRLTTEQVAAIRVLCAKGWTQPRIARLFGVSAGTIWDIAHQKTRRNG